jgi:radical SAM protein with 4Fe4S-binding SPASM domain
MEKGIKLLHECIDNELKIGILVDTDCDGYTSAALIYNFIKDIHDRVDAKFEHNDMLIRMYARDFKVNGNFRAGTLDTIKPQKRNRPCYTIFREIYIDHNGSVMPCCNFRSDIKEHEKFILGNAKDNNIFDIFNGEANLKLRSILCNNEFDLYPCCECTFT